MNILTLQATGNALEKGLRQINRVDIVNQCIFNVEPVTDVKERAVAKAQIDSSVVADSPQTLRKDGAMFNRDASMDVSFDEHELVKVSIDVHSSQLVFNFLQELLILFMAFNNFSTNL